MMNRSAIPKTLERQVKMEAGYRCAIPTCRQTPVEIAHIIPRTRIKRHTFDNLIALCPTCHARYDKREIDEKAMRNYKANLAILNGRYGDLERRVLEIFAEQPRGTEIWLPPTLHIFFRNLVKDGLLEPTNKTNNANPPLSQYCLTVIGREFVQKWLNARKLQ